MKSLELLAWGWSPTAIFPISAFQVARIIGVSHWHPAILTLLKAQRGTIVREEKGGLPRSELN
jgi:hypothetical protein